MPTMQKLSAMFVLHLRTRNQCNCRLQWGIIPPKSTRIGIIRPIFITSGIILLLSQTRLKRQKSVLQQQKTVRRERGIFPSRRKAPTTPTSTRRGGRGRGLRACGLTADPYAPAPTNTKQHCRPVQTLCCIPLVATISAASCGHSRQRTSCRVARGEFHSPGPHRTVREPLSSHGSSYAAAWN